MPFDITNTDIGVVTAQTLDKRQARDRKVRRHFPRSHNKYAPGLLSPAPSSGIFFNYICTASPTHIFLLVKQRQK